MNCSKKLLLFLTGSFICSPAAQAMFPINLFRPFDINLRQPVYKNTSFQVTGWFEQGLHVQGYNAEGEKVNALQIWTPTQNALAMLQGFPQQSPMTQFINNVLQNPPQVDNLGLFKVTGCLSAQAGGLAFRYNAPHNFTFGIHVPFYAMRLHDVAFKNLATQDTEQTRLINRELMDVIKEKIAQFDPQLSLDGWKRTGLGDIVLSADWLRHFPQGKPILKDVALNARLNFTLPTGLKIDVDEIFSIPFGFDGSVGLVFGGGIDINWYNHLRGGIDVEFIYLFGNTRERRIKINADQTEFFFLAKTEAHKNFGFTQRFNLYLQGYQLWRGLSTKITYQYWKHGDDELGLCTNEFSEIIANSAQSLQEWTMHNMIFSLEYDTQNDICENSYFKPQISLFYKLGFNGSRALLVNSVGGIVSFNF